MTTADERALRLANSMPQRVSSPTPDDLDVLIAAAWGACLGVVVVHVCKALLRGLARLRSTT